MHHNPIVAEKHHGKERGFVVKPYPIGTLVKQSLSVMLRGRTTQEN